MLTNTKWSSLFLNRCCKSVISFAILLVILCPDHRQKRDTAAHDSISPLPWKQLRFYLRTLCCLCERDQGIIKPILGFIRFTIFNYSWLTKKVFWFILSYSIFLKTLRRHKAFNKKSKNKSLNNFRMIIALSTSVCT